jgi:hypothetical protein
MPNMPNFLDITENAEYADACETAAVRHMDLATADNPPSFPARRRVGGRSRRRKKGVV